MSGGGRREKTHSQLTESGRENLSDTPTFPQQNPADWMRWQDLSEERGLLERSDLPGHQYD